MAPTKRKKQKNGFKCKICLKKCTTNGNLKRHEMIHNGVRDRFKCNYNNCKMDFSTLENLQRHANTHNSSSIQEFTCAHCINTTFNRKDNLIAHMVKKRHVHTSNRNLLAINQFDTNLSNLREVLREINIEWTELSSDLNDDAEIEIQQRIENINRQRKEQQPLLNVVKDAAPTICNIYNEPKWRDNVNTRIQDIVKEFEELQVKLKIIGTARHAELSAKCEQITLNLANECLALAPIRQLLTKSSDTMPAVVIDIDTNVALREIYGIQKLIERSK